MKLSEILKLVEAEDTETKEGTPEEGKKVEPATNKTPKKPSSQKAKEDATTDGKGNEDFNAAEKSATMLDKTLDKDYKKLLTKTQSFIVEARGNQVFITLEDKSNKKYSLLDWLNEGDYKKRLDGLLKSILQLIYAKLQEDIELYETPDPQFNEVTGQITVAFEPKK